MEIIETAMTQTFDTKNRAEKYCKDLRDYAYRFGVVTVNDALHLADQTSKTGLEGFHYGFIRKKKKMVRDRNGYWTTENDIPEDDGKGGG